MHRSIDKKKIYFYLLIFFFLSTIFNFKSVSKLKDINLIKTIDIKGLKNKEENYLKKNLKIFKNNNIFFIKKDKIENILNIFNFLDNYSIQKVLPSKLIVLAKKTTFKAIAIIEGKKFYIGENGKLTPAFQVTKENNLPMIFGKFSVNEFLNLQKVLNKLNFNLKNIDKYFYHQSNRWDLQFNNGLTLMLPYNNVEKSLKIYGYLINVNLINSVKIIDLRIPNNVVLTHE